VRKIFRLIKISALLHQLSYISTADITNAMGAVAAILCSSSLCRYLSVNIIP